MFDPPGPLDDERPPTPPSPDDRLWRHPSEVAAQARATPTPPPGAAAAPTRSLRDQRFSLGTVVVAGSLGAFAMFASLVALGLVTGMPAPEDDTAVAAVTSVQPVGPSTGSAPDGVVAVRLATAAGVAYGVGVVVDRDGDLVTTLAVDPVTESTLSVAADGTNWSTVTLVASDPVTGLSVLRPSTRTAATPATVTRPQLSQEVRMVRPGAGTPAVLAGSGATRVSGTNANLTTSGIDCVGLTTLTSPRRTGPTEVAVSADGAAVVGLVVPEDDDPEDEVSYAMAADVAVEVAHQLLDDGRALPGVFDASFAPDVTGRRLAVAALTAGGRAESAGLRVGDELLTVDGRRVHSLDDVDGAVLGRAPGDSVVVVVRRGQRQTTLRVPLTVAPSTLTAAGSSELVGVSTTVAG